MRFIQANGFVIHYLAEGPEGLPALVFINPLGCDLRVWSEVASILKSEFRVVAYDKRGHGLSESGPDRCEMADTRGTSPRSSTPWALAAPRSSACRSAA
jgi:3-oxoadipate enol-lactonase